MSEHDKMELKGMGVCMDFSMGEIIYLIIVIRLIILFFVSENTLSKQFL
ncbi:hypothetical protein [Bacillus sp. UNC437CL72CviS29]|nr:hypothetical protein [Bacillus sp. UNC437CL72CviS29]